MMSVERERLRLNKAFSRRVAFGLVLKFFLVKARS